MRRRPVLAGALAAVLPVLSLAGCGGSGAPQVPNAGQVPLVPGSRVVVRVRECDPGASAFCSVDLVVYNRRYRSSDDLLGAERRHLNHRGWTNANAPIGPETAADSPGHRLHLTYAGAGDELQGIDPGWVKRPRAVTLALSRAIFSDTPALAMIVEISSGAS